MGLNWPKPGPSFVPAYQSSGLPYVTRSTTTEVGTSAPIKHSFPYVTRFFIVNNIGDNDLRIGFTRNGVRSNPNANYFVLGRTSGSVRLELRCKDLFFLGEGNATGFELIAGLTNIRADQFPRLTGSNISVGFGAPVTSSWPGVG